MIAAYRLPFQIEGKSIYITIGRTDSFTEILNKVRAFVSKYNPSTMVALPVPCDAPFSNAITYENAQLFTDYFKKRSRSEGVIEQYINDIRKNCLHEASSHPIVNVFQVVKAFGEGDDIWYSTVE